MATSHVQNALPMEFASLMATGPMLMSNLDTSDVTTANAPVPTNTQVSRSS